MRAFFLALLAAIALPTNINLTKVSGNADAAFDWIWYNYLGRIDMTLGDVYRYNLVRYRVWNDLCNEYRDISCKGIPVPKVAVFAPNPLRPGLQGYYNGTDTVFVNQTLVGVDLIDTLAHEMSHYWDSYKGITQVPGPAKQICFSEKRAWAVTDKVNAKYGRDLIGSKWVQWYFHCTPYADELYPS